MKGKLIYCDEEIDVLVDLDDKKRINSITINGLKYTYKYPYTNLRAHGVKSIVRRSANPELATGNSKRRIKND